jgi:hypothetical protein
MEEKDPTNFNKLGNSSSRTKLSIKKKKGLLRKYWQPNFTQNLRMKQDEVKKSD